MTYLGAISASANQAANALGALASAEKAANSQHAANAAAANSSGGLPGGGGGSGLGAAAGGATGGGGLSGGGGGLQWGKATVTPAGSMAAGEVIAALKGLGGRT